MTIKYYAHGIYALKNWMVSDLPADADANAELAATMATYFPGEYYFPVRPANICIMQLLDSRMVQTLRLAGFEKISIAQMQSIVDAYQSANP